MRSESMECEITSKECRLKADRALRDGDRVSARVALERALDADPHDDDSAIIAAMISRDDGDLSRTVSLAARAATLRSFHPAALALIGVICDEIGRGRLARRFLRAALAIAPGFATARSNLARVGGDNRRRRSTPELDAVVFDAVRLLRPRDPSLTVCIRVPRGTREIAGRTVDQVNPVSDQLIAVGRSGELSSFSCDVVTGIPADSDDNPALAWNRAIHRAAGDWILLLESGETVADGLDRLRASLSARSDAVFQTVEVRSEDGQRRQEPRLLRNGPGMRFRGKSRPEIRGTLLAQMARFGVTGRECPIVIADSPRAVPLAAEKRELERAWIEEELDVGPEDPFLRCQLATIESDAGRRGPSIVALTSICTELMADRNADKPLFLEEPVVALGGLLGSEERFEELNHWVLELHRHCAPTNTSLFLEGLAAKGLGEPARAVDRLERARSCLTDARCATSPAVERTGLLTLLGAAHLDAGDRASAASAFGDALAIDPDCTEARLAKLALGLADGRVEGFLHGLDELVRDHGERPGVWLAAGSILASVPGLTGARVSWFEEANRRHPDVTQLAAARVKALVESGRVVEGLDRWYGIEPKNDLDWSLGVVAALASGRELEALPTIGNDAVIAGVLNCFRLWLEQGVIDKLDRALTDLARGDELVPGLAPVVAGWLEECGQVEAARRARLSVSR